MACAPPRPLRSPLPLLAALLGLACGPTTNNTGECDPDGTLPAAGSVCSPAGAVCTQSEDPCGLVLDCKDGTWQERPPSEPDGCVTGGTTDLPTTGVGETTDATATTPTTGAATTGAAGCEPFPEEGSACAMEGEFCSAGCQDPCQFCNVLNCEDGTWQRLEVPPAGCLDCASVCDLVVPAMCAGGPPDHATCVAGCESNLAGDCKLVFNQMLACIGPAPTFTCNAETRPTVVGCEMQFATLYMCMGL